MIGSKQKQQVFYIHGGDSFEKHEDFLERLKTTSLWHLPSQNKFGNGQRWTGTFEANLGDEYEVIMPPMPNRQNAKFIEWSIWFDRHFEFLSDDPIFIGHSLGAMFLAKYLIQNDLPFRPRAIFLMAGAYSLPGFSDKDCGDFLVSPEEASSLSEKYENIVIMHSKDDPIVPFPHGQALSLALPKAEFITFEDKNHFLIEEFPELLQKITELTKSQD